MQSQAKIKTDKNNVYIPNIFIAIQSGNIDAVKVFIENGADVNQTNEDDDEYSPLMIAAGNGQLEILKLLLERGAFINQRLLSGETALIIAAKHGHTHCALELLENPECLVPLNYRDFKRPKLKEEIVAYMRTLSCGRRINLCESILRSKLTPLSKLMWLKRGKNACSYSSGTLSTIRSMLEDSRIARDDVNFKSYDNPYPLLKAALANNVTKLMQLLHQGARLDAYSSCSQFKPKEVTALYGAAAKGNLECLNALIKAGANLEFGSEGTDNRVYPSVRVTSTPIKIAVENDHASCVSALIAGGININKNNEMLLHLAAERGNVKCIKILLNAGADINLLNDAGMTPLGVAVSYGHIDSVSTLLAAGAEINLTGKAANTPLVLAVLGKHKEISKILREKGGTFANKPWHEFIDIAIAKCDLEFLKILIEDGKVDVNEALPNSLTLLEIISAAGWLEAIHHLIANQASLKNALFHAAKNGHLECVDALTAQGAVFDPNCKDVSSPLVIATKNGHAKVALLLKTKLKTAKDQGTIRPASASPYAAASLAAAVDLPPAAHVYNYSAMPQPEVILFSSASSGLQENSLFAKPITSEELARLDTLSVPSISIKKRERQIAE